VYLTCGEVEPYLAVRISMAGQALH
jgi:hypothetical protein